MSANLCRLFITSVHITAYAAIYSGSRVCVPPSRSCWLHGLRQTAKTLFFSFLFCKINTELRLSWQIVMCLEECLTPISKGKHIPSLYKVNMAAGMAAVFWIHIISITDLTHNPMSFPRRVPMGLPKYIKQVVLFLFLFKSAVLWKCRDYLRIFH